MMEPIAPRITPLLCKCGAHAQHRVFKFKLANPAASSVVIARELHTSPANVRQCLSRLRRKGDLSRLCPECMTWQIFSGVCNSCGAELLAAAVPIVVDFKGQSPTNRIHPGGLLGSQVGERGDFAELRLKGCYPNDGVLLKQRMDRALEDGLTRQVKSEVMEWLKAYYPADSITDFAGQLCEREVLAWRANYPLLRTNKNVRKQLAVRVVDRLRLLYPALNRPHLASVTV